MSHVVITSDITHPAVDLIEVTCAARGDFQVEQVYERLAVWALKYGAPPLRQNGPGVALQRAMKDLANGPDRELKTTGRKGLAVYSLIALDLTRVDREENDGQGVGNAEVSARILVDPSNDSISVKISPTDHPAAPLIREGYEMHQGLYSATYDIKPWLTQQALAALGGIKSPDAQGKYWVKASENNRNALLELREIFNELSQSNNGSLRIYMMGHSSDDASIVDLLTDAIMEEADRVTKQIEALITDDEAGKRKLGKRAIATQTDEAQALRNRLSKLGESLGISLEDVNIQIEEVEKRLGMILVTLNNE